MYSAVELVSPRRWKEKRHVLDLGEIQHVILQVKILLQSPEQSMLVSSCYDKAKHVHRNAFCRFNNRGGHDTNMCRSGVKYTYGGNGAEEPYAIEGHYSQFTLLTMTYDARLWNLNMYIKHYSRCASVREIVVVWNKGMPPQSSDFDSAVPVRIRVEQRNSLNNRFKVDPLIKTGAVLELDDDIMMTCDDIECGFRVWREHPDRIVVFYLRLISGGGYKGEKHAQKHKGYNMILTGAAFMDGAASFNRYWSKEAAAGRALVDRFFNCEDVLMNYLYANSSLSREVVEYVRPSWVIDTSKLSGVAISRNTQAHYGVRS